MHPNLLIHFTFTDKNLTDNIRELAVKVKLEAEKTVTSLNDISQKCMELEKQTIQIRSNLLDQRDEMLREADVIAEQQVSHDNHTTLLQLLSLKTR